MNRRLLAYVALFTLFSCCIFVSYNPSIASDLTANFTDGEVFIPENSRFDFKDFTIDSKASNFTAKVKKPGHTQFIDDMGNITINYLELDNMIQSSRDWNENILYHELDKPSWSVDCVMVHEIDFIFHDSLYSAYVKNSSENAIIYLSTPNEQDTADMINSLEFKER